jgi:adenine-specific DNA methylase
MRCVRKAILNIKWIGRIRKYLSKEDLKRLVNALVISRQTVYCIDSPSTSWTNCNVSRMQQPAVNYRKKEIWSYCMTPVLKELHWLLIKYQINFKIILLVYKSLHNLAPDYLDKIIEERCPTWLYTSILPMFTASHSKDIHHDQWKACFFSCCPGILELFTRIH